MWKEIDAENFQVKRNEIIGRLNKFNSEYYRLIKEGSYDILQ